MGKQPTPGRRAVPLPVFSALAGLQVMVLLWVFGGESWGAGMAKGLAAIWVIRSLLELTGIMKDPGSVSEWHSQTHLCAECAAQMPVAWNCPTCKPSGSGRASDLRPRRCPACWSATEAKLALKRGLEPYCAGCGGPASAELPLVWGTLRAADYHRLSADGKPGKPLDGMPERLRSQFLPHGSVPQCVVILNNLGLGMDGLPIAHPGRLLTGIWIGSDYPPLDLARDLNHFLQNCSLGKAHLREITLLVEGESLPSGVTALAKRYLCGVQLGVSLGCQEVEASQAETGRSTERSTALVEVPATLHGTSCG